MTDADKLAYFLLAVGLPAALGKYAFYRALAARERAEGE